MQQATQDGVFRDPRLLESDRFVGVDGVSDSSDAAILAHIHRFVEQALRVSEFHPDAWRAVVIRDPATTRERMQAVAGDKYSYREMDDFTDLIRRTFQTVKQVSKVDRSGVLEEQVTLSFSQERLASYGVPPGRLQDILKARNTALSGGMVEVEGRKVALNPTGEFKNEREIGDVIVGRSQHGAPLYLRDLVDIDRGYESPRTTSTSTPGPIPPATGTGAGQLPCRSRCARGRRSGHLVSRWIRRSPDCGPGCLPT
jgi:hypothetical protein